MKKERRSAISRKMQSKFCEVKVRKVGDLIGTRPQSESKAHSYHSE